MGLARLLLISCISLTTFCVAATDNASTVVDLGYAQYQGNRSNEFTVAFLGLPYAEPPLADLRWRAPLPLNTSRVQEQTGGQVVDATSFPNFCIQGGAPRAYGLISVLYCSCVLVQPTKLAVQVPRTVSKSTFGSRSARRRVTIVRLNIPFLAPSTNFWY